jgi:hypothetical protein
MKNTPNAQLIAELDPDEYDTEAAKIDDRNGNFSPDRVSDYLQTNIVLESLANGQFTQAKAQCEEYGFYYPKMRRAAGLDPFPG